MHRRNITSLSIIMWIYYFLLLKLTLSQAVILFPISPCQSVFSYDDASINGDKWYGELTISATTTVTQLSLRIALDRPAQLLDSCNAPVTSQDNRIYFINDDNMRIVAGNATKRKIMVKFNPSLPVPYLSTVHFNGQRICPPDAPLILQGENGYNSGSTTESNQRPDIEIPINTDLDSHRFKNPRQPNKK